MKGFICMKPGIIRHWERHDFKGTVCCCFLYQPPPSTNVGHFIFKDTMNTCDVKWQPGKCYCLLSPQAIIAEKQDFCSATLLVIEFSSISLP